MSGSRILCFIAVFLFLAVSSWAEDNERPPVTSTQEGGYAEVDCAYRLTLNQPPEVLTEKDYSADPHIASPEWISVNQPDKVAQALEIAPGMTIVDVGTGGGVFTFAFADVLKGTGKVYGTEIREAMVGPLRRRVQEQGYKNVSIVLVNQEGVDPFYGKHAFDLIFCSNVIPDILHAEKFFENIRTSLKKKTGRLCIISFKNNPDFTALEFGHPALANIFQVLTSQGEDFPVYRHLNPAVRAYVRGWKGEAVPQDMQDLIIQDLNGLLKDRTLFKDVNAYYLPNYAIKNGKEEMFFPEDLYLAKQLVAVLEDAGVFDLQKQELSASEQRDLHLLNRLMLSSIFKTREWRDFSVSSYYFYFEKEAVVRLMEKAGYALVKDHEGLLNYMHVLEFKRGR